MMQSIEKLQKLRDAGMQPELAEALVALLEDPPATAAQGQFHHDFIDHKAEVAKYMARMDEIIARHDQAHADHKATMAKMDADHKATMAKMDADSQKRHAEHEERMRHLEVRQGRQDILSRCILAFLFIMLTAIARLLYITPTP